MKLLNCDIMFCKNKTDDYRCCVQWSDSPLTTDDDTGVRFKNYHHISKSELRDIFNHLRQFATLLEIKVSRYKYSRFKMRRVRYVYSPLK